MTADVIKVDFEKWEEDIANEARAGGFGEHVVTMSEHDASLELVATYEDRLIAFGQATKRTTDDARAYVVTVYEDDFAVVWLAPSVMLHASKGASSEA